MRLNIDRQNELEPKRLEFAKNALINLGYQLEVTGKRIDFIHKGSRAMLYPYSGYFSGKTVHDGRGIDNLLNQLKKA